MQHPHADGKPAPIVARELETAVRLGMQLVVLILRDDAYGMIKWKQAHMGLDPYGLDYGNPDFVRYAESYGAHGHLVKSVDRLLPIMQECHASPGVHVIEVPVDYSENDRILNLEIKELSDQRPSVSICRPPGWGQFPAASVGWYKG